MQILHKYVKTNNNVHVLLISSHLCGIEVYFLFISTLHLVINVVFISLNFIWVDYVTMEQFRSAKGK